MPREVPPSDGLPLRLADLLPTGGRDVAAAVAARIGTPPLALTCSGTAALVLTLEVLRRRAPARRAVVVPAYTCPLVAMAVAHAGLELRPCDLRERHYDMDPDALARLCDADTLAVLPTHLAGRVADVATARAIAARHGASVIEDAAQALGARFADGSSVGLAGDAGFFSLAVGKGLSIFEGGLLTSADPSLRQALQAAADDLPRDRHWEARRAIELAGLALLYRPGPLRLVYGTPLRRALRRDDPVAAVGDRFEGIPLHPVGRWRRAVGGAAATRLPAFLDAQHARAQSRLEQLRALPGVQVMDDPAGARGIWPSFLLLLPDRARRDAALARLWTAGLGVSRLFAHALPDYAYLGTRVPRAEVPRARAFAACSLTVSNSAWLDEADFARICRVLGAA